MVILKYLLCFTLLIPSWLTYGQTVQNLSDLKIEDIMKGERFVGYSPTDIFWGEDNETIYFRWNPELDTLKSWYKVGSTGQAPQKVSLEEQKSFVPGGQYNRDRNKKVSVRQGDIILLNLETKAQTSITNTVVTEKNPTFSGDQKDIIYESNDNLFAWNISSGSTTQLTDFRKGKKKEDKKESQEEWLENDQLAYFDILEQRKKTAELTEKLNEELQPKRPLEIYYSKKSIDDIKASPDLNFITFRITEKASPKATIVPDYVTQSGYTIDLNARSKVGSPQDIHMMAIYNVAQDTFYLVNTKNIPGIFDKPEFLKDYHTGDTPYKEQYDEPREVMILSPIYSKDSKALVTVLSTDNKDRWIMQLDLATGQLKLLDRQRDEAWINGPGIGYRSFFNNGNTGWLPDNETVWFQSEETGYSHLYTLNIKSAKKKTLTSGKFEIRNTTLSKDGKSFYLTASAEGPFDYHYYRLPVKGGKMRKITTKSGNHQVVLSPDEKKLAIRYSYSNSPWELYTMSNEVGAQLSQKTSSTTEDFENYSWREPEITWFKASDGIEVPARVYKPEPGNNNGAGVIFVHGAGYLHNVHNWWSGYYREFMFHNLLADNGYTVMDIDYRGSDGYGRDWRTGIYRFMGGKDLSDQVDGAKFMVEELGVDTDRIGMYGGSYGGFITLMAMFTSPGTIKSGAALRSVTDWAHYNHRYTSNILNTPQEDSIAYYKSSPIYHAEGLEGNLLILHGMVDTNVHFQDVVRLSQRLIELGKDNWEFAVFPMESHGFVEPSSWTDEYKRIFKLFQNTLRE